MRVSAKCLNFKTDWQPPTVTDGCLRSSSAQIFSLCVLLWHSRGDRWQRSLSLSLRMLLTWLIMHHPPSPSIYTSSSHQCTYDVSDSSMWTLYVLIKCRIPTFLFNWGITYCEIKSERSQLTFPDITPPLQRVTPVLLLSSIWHYDFALRKTSLPADGS